MKILFVVPSYKPAYVYGGTIVVTALLAEQLVLEGHDVSVYTTNANGSVNLEVETGKELLLSGVKVTYFERITGDHTHISPKLWKRCYSDIKSFDVVHLHSWWNFLIMGVALICKIRGIKPILSPHGMLSDYIINTNNRGKKRFLHLIIGKSLLRNSILHVTSEVEFEEAKQIIPNWCCKTIPNLVKLPDAQFSRPTNPVFTIGFLSRIDPKKGLDILIRALSKVDFEYELLVAGDGKDSYIAHLKHIAFNVGNSDRIKWVGWKNEDEKFNFLSQIDLFTLTSHNENFAIVVVESLSVGTPVLITKEVGLSSYILDSNLGWITDFDEVDIINHLNSIYHSKTAIHTINVTAPLRIRQDFDARKLICDYITLYTKVIS